MRKMEEMETNMRLDDLKQKGGISTDDKKKSKKATLVVEPIQLELMQSNIDRLYYQIYAYFTVSFESLFIRKAYIIII